MNKPVKYLVIINSAGSMVARLFDESRVLAAEFDASSEEVAVMTSGLVPSKTASDPAWDKALRSHSAQERLAADVYVLDV